MLVFFDESFRTSSKYEGISLGVMCGIAIPEIDLARVARDIYLLKVKHLGAKYASEREIKGKELFKPFVFTLEEKGHKSHNLALASDILDYIIARGLRIFGCVCFEQGIQKFEVANVAQLDKTFQYIFERVDMFIKLRHQKDMAILVFDDRNFDTNKTNSEAITKFFQRSARGLALDSIVGTPFFAISQAQNVGLQLADFVTTIVGLRFASEERIQPYFEKLQKALFYFKNQSGMKISSLKVLRDNSAATVPADVPEAPAAEAPEAEVEEIIITAEVTTIAVKAP